MLGLLWLGAAAQAGATCDPTTYTEDPTDARFASLVINDFQDQKGSSAGGWDIPEADAMVIDDLGYWGSGWFTNTWCIPGMDSNAPGCGGENIYLATAMDLHISPTAEADRLGFRWGTQGQKVSITVTLADDSTHTFQPTGQTAFFGYCAPGPIRDIHITGPDGGIDDIRYGLAAAEPEPGDTGLSATDTAAPDDTASPIAEEDGVDCPGTCGCASGPSGGAWGLLVGVGALLVRRWSDHHNTSA